jgi:predicted nucleotidyltransferase
LKGSIEADCDPPVREGGCGNDIIEMGCFIMKDLYYEIGSKIKNNIKKEYDLIDIRVFGSCARDEATVYSDIDVFIEVRELNSKIKKRIREIVWELGLEYQVVISALIFSKYELESTPMKYSQIVENIYFEGVCV